MHSFFNLFFTLVAVLAGRALALNITIGGSLGVIPATQFLNVSDATLASDCQTQCAPGFTAIQACTDDVCLCDMSTVTAVTACEQCMFNDLISKNTVSSDPRAGSATALSAYAAACLASVNVTVPTTEITLTLPSDWDGPFGLGLDTAGTVITLIAGILLAGGSLTILNTM
ncbi:hypothetical protein SCP_1003960 [Sparassis crispa]|uniref:Extracellular membrane protein CFEM domain-containing protein n=1 Tax=Sparassis crispa TaxID=139825 RepID=A0A401GYB3_9APHY|nr:hypothetical protein SCP_1003960 [Sparassis crispa]GBE87149.1 hypothetical protein SCP_1003960 [Sparassis crispa]